MYLRFIKYEGGGGEIFLNAFFCGLHLNFQERKKDYASFYRFELGQWNFLGLEIYKYKQGKKNPLNAYFLRLTPG